MPFLMNDPEEELKKQQEQGQNISGQSSVINGPNASQSKPGNPKSSGSWTNLQKYLDANKENAAQMGSTITSQVDQEATDASNKVNQFKASAPGVTQAKTADEIKGMLDNAGITNKEEYKTLKTTGGYSGPDSFDKVQGYQDAATAHTKASQKVGQLKTEEGRQTLLADTYKRPNYSQGQKTFDNLLLQNDPNSKKMFEDTSSKWSGINSLLDSATSDVGNRINTNKANAYSNKQLISGDGVSKGVEAQYLEDFINPISQRVDQFNTQSGNKRSAVQSDLTDDALTTDTLGLLGLTEGQNLYDLNLNKYVNYDATQANIDNVATGDERAKWSALQNLIDGTDSRITSGGKSISPVGFDKSMFDSDFAKSKAAADSAVAQADQQYNSSIAQADAYAAAPLPHKASNEYMFLRSEAYSDPRINGQTWPDEATMLSTYKALKAQDMRNGATQARDGIYEQYKVNRRITSAGVQPNKNISNLVLPGMGK